jgi:hypothetical protein
MSWSCDTERVFTEASMVELRRLDASSSLPADRNWALVESARGVVAAKGSLVRSLEAPFGPALFDDLEGALDAMKAWASENDVAVVYVREA